MQHHLYHEVIGMQLEFLACGSVHIFIFTGAGI